MKDTKTLVNNSVPHLHAVEKSLPTIYTLNFWNWEQHNLEGAKIFSEFMTVFVMGGVVILTTSLILGLVVAASKLVIKIRKKVSSSHSRTGTRKMDSDK